MKIVLIKPPEEGLLDQTAYPPMGLLYVGAALIEAGFEVELCILTDSDFSKIPDGDVYGINMHGPGVFSAVMDLASDLKFEHPDAPIIAGGAFATCAPKLVLDRTLVDVIVLGEGEIAIVDLCKQIEKGEPFNDWDNAHDGIAFCDESGDVVETGRARPIKNLDELPLPARHLMDSEMVRYRGGVHHAGNIPATTIIVSRGCPFNCAFCDRETWGRKHRVRSHSSILYEIDKLIKNYGITWFRFVDDNMMVDRCWFDGLLDKMIELTPDISWTCLARAEDVDLELLQKMKQAGCKEIFFGCESGSQKLLDAMNKKTTVEANVTAIELCREAQITSCAYLLFGFPGEDAQTVFETKQFLRTARPDKSRISTFLPVPGSDVYRNPLKYGVKIKFDPSNFWYFDDHDFCVQYSNITNKEMAFLRDNMMEFYKEMGFTSGWAYAHTKEGIK